MDEKHTNVRLEPIPAATAKPVSDNIEVPPKGSARPMTSAAMPSSQFLRDVADEVRSSFVRAPGKPQLVLIEVDPYRVHAFWTVTREAMQRAQDDLGGDAANACLILRIRDDETSDIGEAEATALDVEVGGLKSRSYVDIFSDARRYRAALGLRTADNRFAALATSNAVELPPLSAAASNAVVQINTQSPHAGSFSPQPVPPPGGATVQFPLPPDFIGGHAVLRDDAPRETQAPSTATGSAPRDNVSTDRPPLVLEQALTSSSYGLGRADGFEVAVELHVFGHAEPGQLLSLFGRNVPLRPDGSFSIRRHLPNDPSVIEALLNSGDASTDGGGS